MKIMRLLCLGVVTVWPLFGCTAGMIGEGGGETPTDDLEHVCIQTTNPDDFIPYCDGNNLVTACVISSAGTSPILKDCTGIVGGTCELGACINGNEGGFCDDEMVRCRGDLFCDTVNNQCVMGCLWTSIPLPEGNEGMDIFEIWGIAADDIFASGVVSGESGPAGTVMHYDGVSWTNMTLPAPPVDDFVIPGAFWGLASDDIYAVSSTYWLHYDGQWSQTSFGAHGGMGSLWGTSASDLYTTGNLSTLKFNGTDWIELTRPASIADVPWVAVWGFGANNIFFVQNNGVVHYDGANWTVMPDISPINEPLLDIWGLAANDMYAVGQYGNIYHYDGTSWSQTGDGEVSGDLSTVWGSAALGVFAVGNDGVFRYDGEHWTRQDEGGIWASAVWGVGDNLYIGGLDGLFMHARCSSL